MYAVHLVADHASRDLAERLEADLKAAGHPITRTTLERYPIGDSLPALLHRLPPSGGVAVVVVSSPSPNRARVVKELGIDPLYRHIFLAVAEPAELPQWARREGARVVLPGRPLPELLG